MDSDILRKAEAFIDKVAARHRPPLSRDLETGRARAKLAAEDRELALRELAGALDVKRLDALAAERAKAQKQLAQEAHRRAVEGSAAAAERLRRLNPILPPPPIDMMVVLDQVTFIRSFAGEGVVADSNIESFNNWAQYKFDVSGDAVGNGGAGRLSFFTLWQNSKNKPVVVQAGAQLNVNAHLSVDADWNGVASWFLPDSEARATVRARTTVWGMDSSVSSVVQDQVLSYLEVTGGFFGGSNEASIEFNDLLPATGVVVPAKEFVLIEVGLLTEWYALDASVHLDAESGSFKVILPQLELMVQS